MFIEFSTSAVGIGSGDLGIHDAVVIDPDFIAEGLLFETAMEVPCLLEMACKVDVAALLQLKSGAKANRCLRHPLHQHISALLNG